MTLSIRGAAGKHHGPHQNSLSRRRVQLPFKRSQGASGQRQQDSNSRSRGPSQNVFLRFRGKSDDTPAAGAAGSSSRPTTLTKGEQAIFERIRTSLECQQALTHASTSPSQVSLATSTKAPARMLTDVFSEALDPDRCSEAPHLLNPRNPNARTRISTMTISAKSAPVEGMQHSLDGLPVDQKDTHLPTNEYAKDVLEQIHQTHFDHEIHEILQSHVFANMRAFVASLAGLESGTEKSLPKLLLEEHPTRQNRLRTSASLSQDCAGCQSTEMVQATAFDPVFVSTSVATVSPFTKGAAKESIAFALLKESYGPILLHAAHTLRTRFSRSPYLLSLLQLVKSFGPISYVMGASTALYNELLLVRWSHYRDLHGCADLFWDMLAGAVPADEATFAVFGNAVATREREVAAWRGLVGQEVDSNVSDGSKGPSARGVNLANSKVVSWRRTDVGRVRVAGSENISPLLGGWWQLQGTQSGWERWQAAHEEALARFQEDSERKAEQDQPGSADEGVDMPSQGCGDDEVDEPAVVVYDYMAEACEESDL